MPEFTELNQADLDKMQHGKTASNEHPQSAEKVEYIFSDAEKEQIGKIKNMRNILSESTMIREDIEPKIEVIDNLLSSGVPKEALKRELLQSIQEGAVMANGWGGNIDLDRLFQLVDKLGVSKEELVTHPIFDPKELRIHESKSISIEQIINRQIFEDVRNTLVFTNSRYHFDETKHQMVENDLDESGHMILTDISPKIHETEQHLEKLKAFGFEYNFSEMKGKYGRNLKDDFESQFAQHIKTMLTNPRIRSEEYIQKGFAPFIDFSRRLGFTLDELKPLVFYNKDYEKMFDLHRVTYGDLTKEETKKGIVQFDTVCNLLAFMQHNNADLKPSFDFKSTPWTIRGLEEYGLEEVRSNVSLESLLAYAISSKLVTNKDGPAIQQELINSVFTAAETWDIPQENLIKTAQHVITVNLAKPEKTGYYSPHNEPSFVGGASNFLTLYNNLQGEAGDKLRQAIFTPDFIDLPEVQNAAFQATNNFVESKIKAKANTQVSSGLRQMTDIFNFHDEVTKQLVTHTFQQGLIQSSSDLATSLIDDFQMREWNFDETIAEAPDHLQTLFEKTSIHSFDQLEDFLKKYPDYLPLMNQAASDTLAKDTSHSLEALEKLMTSLKDAPQEIISGLDLIDEKMAGLAIKDSHQLIKFIKFLGDEQAITQFPATVEKLTEAVESSLSTNTDLADYFLKNLGKYYQQSWAAKNIAEAVKQYSVAQKFIHAVDNEQPVWKDEPWVTDVLAQAKTLVEQQKKQWEDDQQHQDEYGYSHGSEGFAEKDPFENHKWRFTGYQVRLAAAVASAMTGEADEAELKKLWINSESQETLREVNQRVEQAYQNFLSQVESSSGLSEDDKRALLHPEDAPIKMKPLIDNVRSLVARYLVQNIEGDATKLSQISTMGEDLDHILEEGFRRYIKVNEVDVPLYDKLYEEFDNYRETGRYPLEVYLGRDGIYAYEGRRAQDIARRRKLGAEGRARIRQAGEVLEIHPKYMVYPRYFRDNLNYKTKRQFLEQEGISPEADPLFYDTGYTGTIPEQIMKVMDFDDVDIERRIRLLSAPTVARRVKGIPENALSEIIEYIEQNAKLEQPAQGLIVDERSGKIRHIAEPTTPDEQFYYMMVKQAIARHYWQKEHLYHEPSGNVNMDSEHYAVHIRQEYAQLLPEEFLKNPQECLAEHGELLKGSKGEGEYPDEEITLFNLTDGTEIVAKRVELRKAKEASKEFSILIAAKKANLPTADPVGFLSGKQEADGNYLLMGKVEGISGRKFEKQLRESGKYTDEQVTTIMQTVAEKNREMAELFRDRLHIDKRWRIKDTIIQFNEETGEVEDVVPIDWERVEVYDPANPKEIDKAT